MYLTQKEERALAGEYGEPLEIAYRVLVALGRMSDAKELIPIKWAHVSGVSYLTIGEYGSDFLARLSRKKGTKFRVFTTVNPCGMDIENWNELKIPAEYAEKQLKIISFYQKLGTANSFTCVPYQSYQIPPKRTPVAWAESSAAIFANSILGLRTNRESAVSALASALTGKSVRSGLHLDEYRKPAMAVRVSIKQTRDGGRKFGGALDYGVLGYFAGKRVAGVIEFQGIHAITSLNESKALSASIGTVGSSGMFTVGTTRGIEVIEFTQKEYEETLGDLSDSRQGEAIIFGCPQMTIEELYDLSKGVAGKQFRRKCIVFCSQKVYELAKTRGYAELIEKAGATFVRDSCADFTPLISSLGVGSVVTDSAKGAHYMKRVHGVGISLESTESILSRYVA